MNHAQTFALLRRIAGEDKRIIDDAVVEAWQEILADDEFVDCRAAVLDHQRNRPDDYLRAGHVHLGAVAARRERELHAEYVAGELRRQQRDDRSIQSPPVDPEETKRLLAELRAKLPPSRPGVLGDRVIVQRGKPRTAPSAFGSIGLRLVADLAPDVPEAEAS